MNDNDYMAAALQLAGKGCGFTSPNPMVGAVIVKNGEIIGQGWHEKYGEAHAERNALTACTENPKGATMYVTLEPCCHYGKQPPCVDAIIEAGIRRVVIGSSDPNPLVSGKGIEILRRQGVTVTEHIMQKECDRLNDVFFHYIQTKRPFVVMKYAMTMDGKIATQRHVLQLLKYSYMICFFQRKSPSFQYCDDFCVAGAGQEISTSCSMTVCRSCTCLESEAL